MEGEVEARSLYTVGCTGSASPEDLLIAIKYINDKYVTNQHQQELMGLTPS